MTAPERIPLPAELPVLPLRGLVVYPFTVASLTIGKERSVRLIDEVVRGDRLLVVVGQKDERVELAGPDDVFRVGTAGRILQLLRQPNGILLVAVQGLERVRLPEFVQTEPFLAARVEPLPEREDRSVEAEALRRHVLEQVRRVIELAKLPSELLSIVEDVDDPLRFAYLVAFGARIEQADRQRILELDTATEKLRLIRDLLNRELQVLEVGQRIASEAAEQMSKTQREYILREQLRAIRRELGEEEDGGEIEELRRRLDAAGLPEEARKEADRELNRLRSIPAASPEYGIIRTYLDWLASLPWNRSTGGEIDVAKARAILDEDHYDLEKIKERILEYLAVRKLRAERQRAAQPSAASPSALVEREPILCFVGPPGVGKTSLGQSIARAMGRKFVRMSLGGIRDEAEIRGHRRTYIGALPGRIIQSLRRAEANDPVLMLDEVDKLAVGFQGDPAAALLEVLDPAQNHAFVDLYLGVPFDLSRVLFITTANTLETIPGPLRDRMEVLELSGYTEEEKLRIAERYLVPKQREANGLRPDEIAFSEEALRKIIREHTREAGVRTLERQIATICRKVARQIAEGKPGPITITAREVEEYLGRPRFFEEIAERTDRPGIAIGLAWTPVGGDILFVETAAVPGKDGLILTGMLGDVMRESAQAALTYVRSNAEALGLDPRALADKQVHIHVPAGAIPKDGPSAGIAIATALASLASGRPVRSDVAMTGEVTLRGKVLPVGGIKEKVLAAHRAGIKTVILPKRNERDLEDVPADVRQALRFVLVDTADVAIATALGQEGAEPALRPSEDARERVAARPT